jgi:site-specific DNA-cytosine methylase
MNCLELFSGTGSVGRELKARGHKVTSLDLKGADINCDILNWNYKDSFIEGEFDYIHASPPCETFSLLRRSWIGRKIKAHGDTIITPEILLKDEIEIGVVILNKLLEIIDYFKPTYFTIENPQNGNMKKYMPIDIKYSDVNYCMYGFTYAKKTRIWNNFGFNGVLCDKSCGSIENNKHLIAIGGMRSVNKQMKYRIPPKLINSWLDKIEVA